MNPTYELHALPVFTARRGSHWRYRVWSNLTGRYVFVLRTTLKATPEDYERARSEGRSEWRDRRELTPLDTWAVDQWRNIAAGQPATDTF